MGSACILGGVLRPTAAVLAQIPLFRRVSADDRERLVKVSHLRLYERGDQIFAEGDPSDFFYVVVTGRVKVYKHTPSGSDLILEIFGPGGPLGAVAANESRPYPASSEALESTTCLLIPRQTFFELLEQHPSLVRGLLGSLSLRLVELTTRLAELTGGEASLTDGHGTWRERVRGKEVLKHVMQTCFRIQSADGTLLQGDLRIREVARALVKGPLEQQPDDLRALHELLRTRIGAPHA